jgi:hypothetical protein
VRNVHIGAGTDAWRPAELEPPRGRQWQRFSMFWAPQRRGTVVLAARAEATDGMLQPILGRRNAVHDVTVNII